MDFGLTCPHCGDNRFKFPETLNSDEQVKCEDCGHSLGTVEELKRKVEKMLESRRRR